MFKLFCYKPLVTNITALIIFAVALIIGIAIYIIAFFQGREISLGPLKIGAKPTNSQPEPQKSKTKKIDKAKQQDIPESNLPPKTYRKFIGRKKQLNQIIKIICDPDNLPIISIIGLGGMGKTALAREVAEYCHTKNIFDYIIWTSAKQEHFIGEKIVRDSDSVGFREFEDLLNDIAHHYGKFDILDKLLNEKQSTVKQLLMSQRTLIVLDNLESVSNQNKVVKQLFHILGKSKVLITSRKHIDFQHLSVIDLSELSKKESLAFLQGETQRFATFSINNENLEKISKATGGLPLAMKLVIGQLYDGQLEIVLERLKKVSFKGQDYELYKFIYHDSWNMLDENSRMVLVDMSRFPLINPTTQLNQYRIIR